MQTLSHSCLNHQVRPQNDSIHNSKMYIMQTNVYLKMILDGDKVSDYEMKLMDLDTEHLGIPVSDWSQILLRRFLMK